MPIKDKAYWKEYNQKRKEKGYFQSNYLQRKQSFSETKDKVVNNSEVVKNNSVVKSPEVVKSEVVKLEPVVKVVKTETENILQPKSKEVVKGLQPTETLQPNLQPKLEPCFHCHQYPVPNPGEAYCLVCAEWLKEKTEWKERVSRRDKIIKELDQTILRLKEKLRSLASQNQIGEPNQNHKEIPKGDNIIPCLFDKKHKKTIFYSCPDPCYQGKSCSNCGLLLVRP